MKGKNLGTLQQDGLNEVANSPRMADPAVVKDDTDVYFSRVKKIFRYC